MVNLASLSLFTLSTYKIYHRIIICHQKTAFLLHDLFRTAPLYFLLDFVKIDQLHRAVTNLTFVIGFHLELIKYKIHVKLKSSFNLIILFWIWNIGIHMYWCTVNRTFHRANPSTLKHFIRHCFSFPIVSYGVWDGESYKKN